MNCILKYAGGKWRIADWIISHFPTHRVYLEPFFGSGAVFFNKSKVHIETINDIDNDIVNLFEIVRTKPEELARLIDLTPFARQEFILCNERPVNKVEQARRTLVRYWQSFGTSNSSLNSFKCTSSINGPDSPKQWKQLPGIILNIFNRLKDAQIECYDAFQLIQKYNSPDTLIYCDPPYLQSLRKRCLYKNELKDKQHNELLEVLKVNKSKIILSAYENEVYDTELKDWPKVQIRTIAQAGQPRVETLYMNFQQPGQLSFI